MLKRELGPVRFPANSEEDDQDFGYGEEADNAPQKTLQNKKRKLMISQTSVSKTDKHVRMIIVDFSNFSVPNDDNDDYEHIIQRLELLLNNKFSLQQAGKKKWLLNRELEYEKFFPVEFMNDQQFVLNHIKKYGYGLKFASSQLQEDRDFVLEAVQQNGSELQYTHHNIHNDQEVVLAAIKQQADAFQYASEYLLENKEFVLQEVCQNGNALWFSDRTPFRSDIEVILAAVKQNGDVLECVVEHNLEINEEIIFEAIKQNNKVLRWVSQDILLDHNFMLKALNLIFPELVTFDYSNKAIQPHAKNFLISLV
ncbi:hypothetical protein C9374_013686 [Naegleria lovaniensis]|uniref:DUF4116 domain-containing protein n=1 Tax=Naegleria lovaniensis TaxID=51637 RepID=A0AA88KH96_NAELO|nr:uncharacterized protein C9374_013686 [Naegleria lovaniensis]KAG2372622.1 hypothetical protein C9374_013686 [Naegleria lovaniensis]